MSSGIKPTASVIIFPHAFIHTHPEIEALEKADIANELRRATEYTQAALEWNIGSILGNTDLKEKAVKKIFEVRGSDNVIAGHPIQHYWNNVFDLIEDTRIKSPEVYQNTLDHYRSYKKNNSNRWNKFQCNAN